MMKGTLGPSLLLSLALAFNRISLTNAFISHLPTLFSPTTSLELAIKASESRPTEPHWIDQEVASWHERANRLFKSHGNSTIESLDPPIVRSYENLFGLPTSVSRSFVAEKGVKGFDQWENITRGSDVFIKGMGTFDLMSAYQRIVKRRWRKHKLDVLWDVLDIFDSFPPELEELSVSGLLDTCDHDKLFHSVIARVIDDKELAANVDAKTMRKREMLKRSFDHLKESLRLGISSHEHIEPCDYFEMPFWYVDMRDLWVEGYFPAVTIDSITGASEPILPSLRDTVNARDNLHPCPLEMNRRENIVRLLKADKDLPARRHFINYRSAWKNCLASSMGKADGFALDELAAFTNPQDRGDTAWPSNGMRLNPKELLKKLSLDFRFTHLDHLPDAPNLKVLRTLREVKQVARDLENCVHRLGSLVRERTCIFVALCDEDESGPLTNKKAIALGLHTYDTNNLALDWNEITMTNYALPGKQIWESYTNVPTKQVLDAYSNYRPTIEKWWTQYSKEDWFSGEYPRIDWSNLFWVWDVVDSVSWGDCDLDEAIVQSIQNRALRNDAPPSDFTPYSNLDHLPDPRAPGPHHHLEVQRSTWDINYVLEKLKLQDSVSLDSIIQDERKCIFVEYSDVNCNTKALGWYPLDQDTLACDDWIWIKREDFKDLPEEVLRVCNEYKDMIKAWREKYWRED